MRHDLWRALLSASTDIDRQVASAAGELPSPVALTVQRSAPRLPVTSWREPGGLSTAIVRSLGVAEASPSDDASSRERERLAGLRMQVRTLLEGLWRELEGEVGFDRVRRALVIYFDERVMSLLPEPMRLSWPLLQTELTRSTSGGSDFFRSIDEALDDPRAPSLVFEIYYFCLEHGFVGMYAHEPRQLEEIARRLAARIDRPAPQRAMDWTLWGEERVLPRTRPIWAYYVWAIVFVASMMAIATLASNFKDMSPG